jgi:hypothetical protein
MVPEEQKFGIKISLSLFKNRRLTAATLCASRLCAFFEMEGRKMGIAFPK